MRQSVGGVRDAAGVTTAVQYIRMSTDYQDYSPENQKRSIAEFAARHNITIVATYEDAGKSGLTLRARSALAQLLADVQSPTRAFDAVLVYDVSRWGRFQDVDESAHYEFMCRKAGVDVIYCAENFTNDGSSASNILKTLKRAMAGEYSRELSQKVFFGQRRLAERGFWQGSSPGYGLRRVLVDADGQNKGALQHRQRKNIQSDRVVIVPGPSHEVALIRRIYEWYAFDGVSPERIAQRLNAFGIFNDRGNPWQTGSIGRILKNEKYAGTNVYGRTSKKLNAHWMNTPAGDWVRAVGAFEPVVDRCTFDAAQERRNGRTRLLTDEAILRMLAHFLEQEGLVTKKAIDKNPILPAGQTYTRRFGSILKAYEAIGFEPRYLDAFAETYKSARRILGECIQSTKRALEEEGHHLAWSPDRTMVRVDNELRIKFSVRVIHRYSDRSSCWRVRWPTRCAPDLLVICRLDTLRMDTADVYVLPRGIVPPIEETTIVIHDGCPAPLDGFRFPDTQILLELTARVPLEVLDGQSLIHYDSGNSTRSDTNSQSALAWEPATSGDH